MWPAVPTMIDFILIFGNVGIIRGAACLNLSAKVLPNLFRRAADVCTTATMEWHRNRNQLLSAVILSLHVHADDCDRWRPASQPVRAAFRSTHAPHAYHHGFFPLSRRGKV